MQRRNLLQVIGPGILVAATGVGAGDLATASLTGSVLGLGILWAVVLGSFMKFVLNEGLTRWQLATGSTLIEGCVAHFGKPAQWLFLGYLVLWSFFVSAALMGAVGVTCHAILPLTGHDAQAASLDKILYGVLHSALAVVLVQVGGYRLFEKVMSVCISLMFLVVVVSAAALGPHVGELVRGLLLPLIPAHVSGGALWTVALIGGIGGTVTSLCYGYWIREEGRLTTKDLSVCRIDLATGYAMTAMFGIAMVIIGNSLGQLEGGGAKLVVEMADRLEASFGRAGGVARWAFLIGAWAAVFSSLLGVWQSIPYLFADLWQLMRVGPARAARIDTRSVPYVGYLYALATVPILGMSLTGFQSMQVAYAVIGALFVPMLAVALLILNGRAAWVGAAYKNSWGTVLVLVGTTLFFAVAGAMELKERLLPE